MKYGFTILELIVVIAISATITAGGIASYSTFSKQQKLTNETKKFEDILDSARQKAIASENSDICETDPGYSLFAYQVDVTNADASGIQNIILSAYCVNNSASTETKQISTYPIDKSVTVLLTPITVRFLILTGNLAGVVPTITIQSSSSKQKRISISPLGVIEEL